MADVTPRENTLYFLILNRSIYLSNWIRIAIFAFKFHESYFLSTLDVFFFFLSFFFAPGSETSSPSTPDFEISKNMKDLKHNISSVKDTSTASMIAVSLFEYYRALSFCPLQVLYLNYQPNHTSKGRHIVK